ncbi:PGPGW domain-containing protein [Pararoseomonas sp. SCSIO 73927]|uniref:PGPGW domain-containing protein n=1 Tax=Pararoseomonas sp. SCSIO 73927 TaxID=3114537 RepID=UPI0030D56241
MDDRTSTFITLKPRPGRKALGLFFIVLGVLGLVLPFLQGFLFLALGIFVLRDQYIWAANRWAWVAGRWPGAVSRIESLETSLNERVAGWGMRVRRAIGRG